jgi:S-adenosylmethionine hydrolase
LGIITLLTDFGLRDGYSGVMRGVIWNILPDAQIADISHTIAPQNILDGPLALARTSFFFPEGTVHVAVVDPGVGTPRLPVAFHTGGHYFVGPDNGLFTLILEHAEKEGWPVTAVCLDQPQYWLKNISRVFHGRDIFSPVAAYIASGVPLEKLGAPINDLVRLEIPRPQRTDTGWSGQVIGIDHFGNLLTNITRSELNSLRGELIFEIAGQLIHGLAATFGARPSGDLTALIGTHDDLDIAVVNGDAAELLSVQVGAAVRVEEAAH